MMIIILYGLAGIVIIGFKLLNINFISYWNSIYIPTDNLKLKITCKELFYLKSITYRTGVNKVLSYCN